MVISFIFKCSDLKGDVSYLWDVISDDGGDSSKDIRDLAIQDDSFAEEDVNFARNLNIYIVFQLTVAFCVAGYHSVRCSCCVHLGI